MAFVPTPVDLALLEVFLLLTIAESIRIVFWARKPPPIVLELVVGTVLSSYALGGILNSTFHVSLFVVNSQVLVLADISLILIIFGAGLEGGFSSLRQAGMPATLGAIAGTLAPFVVTFVAFSRFYNLPTSLFVAVSAGSTSTAVVVSMVRSEALAQTRWGRFLLAMSALDDVVGLVLLSAIVTITVGNFTPVSLAEGATLTVILWVLLLFAAVYLVPQGLRLVGRRESYYLPFLVLFIMVVLVSAVGFSAIVGAYIAGLAIAESVLASRTKQMAEVLLAIFGSMFFVVIGAQFNVRLLTDPALVLFALLLVAIAVTVKTVVILPFVRSRFHWRYQARLVVVGMIPRGEIGLVVGSIGLSLGILNPTVFGEIVLMSVLTTVIGGVLFHRYAVAERVEAARTESPITAPENTATDR